MIATASGTNTAAVVTIAVPASAAEIQISAILASYSAPPGTTGNLTIAGLQTSVTFDVDITESGLIPLPFLPIVANIRNTNVVVTLAAGGEGVTGKLNIIYRLV